MISLAAAKMKRIWDNRKFIGEFMKTDKTKVVVELVARDGVKLINVKAFYMHRTTQQWTPTFGDGIIIPIALPINGEVARPAADWVQLLHTAINNAADFKIDDPDNAVWVENKPRPPKVKTEPRVVED